MAGPTSTKEALQAQMLEDVDGLLTRLERLESGLSIAIAEATKDAAGKALLATRLSFEEVLDRQSMELIDSGRLAAREIKQALTAGYTRNKIAGSLQPFFLHMALSLVGGVAGGLVVLMLQSK